ncbi:MAG: hypothetical protein Q9M40_14195 [Sulfurimonas sp.]|nr:hypothetical protein [Sulfurimonas sp.]
MKHITQLLLILLTQQLFAQMLISPIDAMKENYDLNATISKKIFSSQIKNLKHYKKMQV